MQAIARLMGSQIGETIHARHGGRRVPDWKVARVVTDLESRQKLTVERVSKYRVIVSTDLDIVAAELHRLGWLPTYSADSSSAAVVTA